jgi:hypothetical protein
MFCSNCGSGATSAATFCLDCGHRLKADTAPLFQSRPVPPPPANTAKTASAAKIIMAASITLLLGVAFLAAAAGIIHWTTQQSSNTNYNSGTSTSSSSVPFYSPPPPVRTQLVPSTFVVRPQDEYSRQFTLSRAGRVTGDFQSDTNIVVYLVNDKNFRLFSNGNGFNSFYRSEKISSGVIDVNLPPDTYYIIFSNNYSIISSKHIAANLYVEE